jgi:hypothetical protein
LHTTYTHTRTLVWSRKDEGVVTFLTEREGGEREREREVVSRKDEAVVTLLTHTHTHTHTHTQRWCRERMGRW